ncbi:MAG: hypothetical protein SH847_12680 [Roseiflexaceae bacterium]|nr:hypothetical protein [Roseiflexaceae bacterium]
MSIQRLFAGLLCMALLASCAARSAAPAVNTPVPVVSTSMSVPTVVSSPIATVPLAPSPTLTPAPTVPSGPPTIVPTQQRGADPPGPIYYIDGRQQLSRVATNGTIEQLTDEIGNLIDFDISPADSSIAYLLFAAPTKMLLVQVDPQGKKRTEIATGVFRQLMFNPSGTQLAFAVDLAGAKAGDTELSLGVWSLPADGGPITQLLVNTPPQTAADGQVIPGLRNAPAAWSPDGKQLLLYTAPDFGPDAPAGDIGVVGLSVLNMANGTTTELIPPGGNPRLCLVPVWNSTGDAIYCATPYGVGDETPALFRINLADQTQTELVVRASESGRTTAVQGVWAGNNGITALFTYNQNDAPVGAAFERFTSDPSKRTVIASAKIVPEFSVPVLWAPDGRGALYMISSEQPALIWQPFDGGQPRVLVQDLVGRTRWGR